MRQFIFFVLVLSFAIGCSKKKPEPADGGTNTPEPAPVENTAALRTGLLNNLKSTSEKTKLDAIDELAAWVDSDPETAPALIELLKDKTNAGPGKTHAMRITSTREAAARVLAQAGPKGEAALKEKGFAALRTGLTDPQPAVREHTAYTIGLIGPIAKPLSADVMALCTDPESKVHGAAFDALRYIGIADVPGFAKLLTHDNREIANLAAELVPTLPEVPDAAVSPLTAALDSDAPQIRTAAAAGLAIAGPKAAPAAAALVEAIKKTESYQGEYDPERPFEIGSEMAYWRALGRIGPQAVAPTAGLLAHKHAIVRGFAAETLGQIGIDAKPAADKLIVALKDPFGFVAIEAACALCRIGESKDEAIALVKLAIEAPNSVARTAIDAIPRMGDAGKSLVPAALEKLKSTNPYARYAAIGLVGTLPASESMAAAAELGKLATDPEPEIRERVAIVLEKLGSNGAPAAEALGRALATEKSDAIRERFVDALVAMGPGAKPALTALLPLAAESSLPVERRTRVIAAIAAADPASKEVATSLLSAAADRDPTIRAAAATAIGKLNPLTAEALAKLVALAKTDSRTEPRLAALRALADAGPRAASARGDIESIANGKQQDGQALLAKVAVAAMNGDAAKAAVAVRAGLADRKPDVRAAATAALAGLGPTAADVPVLLKLLKDRSAEAREGAAKCLGRLGPTAKDAVPQLIKLLDDTVPEVRIAAAIALGDIGEAALLAVPKLKATVRDDRPAEPAARKALEKLGANEGGVKR